MGSRWQNIVTLKFQINKTSLFMQKFSSNRLSSLKFRFNPMQIAAIINLNKTQADEWMMYVFFHLSQKPILGHNLS